MEDKFPLIDAYLTGHISDKENQELNELRKIPEFEQEFQFRQDAFLTAKALGRRELKSRLQSLDQPAKVIRFRNWWALAAAMILLLLAVPFLFDHSPSDKLYAEFYSTLPNKIDPITRGESTKSELRPALIEYERANYTTARQLFEEKRELNPDVEVYIAITHLEEGQFNEAIKILQPISENSGARFRQEAKWYLALAHLGNSNKDQATALLQEISKSQSMYQNRAKELLAKLL
ncbi:tetratricopeptide repeat protein [Portibacter marinus]|uniref:tetratricopeptide repeat protein n=1 Tax=Portibacter marinus TaxID=2898660 RepID=UPI001F40DB8E|nr:tetratricopeptide repeat protein [Portibacter marinus]